MRAHTDTRGARLAARPAFTLIELLVVVVIIGTLASIALPSFVGAQDRARNASVQSNLALVRTGLEYYVADHNGTMPSNSAIWGATGLGQHNYLPGNRAPKSPWSTDPQTVRVCPANSPLTDLESLNSANVPHAGSSFSPPLAGAVAPTAPTLMNHYGLIATDTDNAGDVTAYYIVGVGKKNRHCLIAGAIFSGGK